MPTTKRKSTPARDAMIKKAAADALGTEGRMDARLRRGFDPYSLTSVSGVGDERTLRNMIDRSLENIELIRQRMANDQIEIDSLRQETRSILAQILA